MSVVAESTFGELADWQAMLDRHGELFAEMVPGSSVAIVPREGSGIQPGKHVAGLKAAGGSGDMLRWEVTADGMRASVVPYLGFQDAKVDLLFVAEAEALDKLRADIGEATLPLMKRQIRAGSIMFFVMRTKYELQDAGYEEFLDSLGLAFLGACR
ncbi:MAG: hypothetical protein DPW12_09900 [Rhodocyclaceae bacterium]|nr:hypothetical protein [Rhodocyclaceae bacterium]HNQ57858.1 hypothetical protein [Candidatus Desulfobacillus denitrificans]HNT63808.1 hypothetical protein [Candidatus Desulfobacillus denitrificans]